jgi:hypothetical protein|uniref:Uncharacterized protein n=1 Tax=viral metagenome TaxID=1070528 RepID=A0A6C0JVW8_9ZZZZ
MSYDEPLAILFSGCLLLVLGVGQFSHFVLETLVRLTRPGATVFLLGVLAFLYIKKLHYSFLVFAVLVIYFLRDVWDTWMHSDARGAYIDRGVDQDRFNPFTSIDLQMADKSVVHASPSMYFQPPTFTDGLLVFPPSAEVLEELNGSTT